MLGLSQAGRRGEPARARRMQARARTTRWSAAKGCSPTHVVCDHLLLEIPDAVYDRDMLLNTEFAAVSGGADLIAPGHAGRQPGRALDPPRQHRRTSRTCSYDIAATRERGHRAWRRGDHAAHAAEDVRDRRPRPEGRSGDRRHAAVRHRAAEGVRARVHEALRHAGDRSQALVHRRRQGVPAQHRHPLLPDLGRRPRRADEPGGGRRGVGHRVIWGSSSTPTSTCCRTSRCGRASGTRAWATSPRRSSDYGSGELRRRAARLHPALPAGEEGSEGAPVRSGGTDRVLHRPRRCRTCGGPTSSRPSRTGKGVFAQAASRTRSSRAMRPARRKTRPGIPTTCATT